MAGVKQTFIIEITVQWAKIYTLLMFTCLDLVADCFANLLLQLKTPIEYCEFADTIGGVYGFLEHTQIDRMSSCCRAFYLFACSTERLNARYICD